MIKNVLILFVGLIFSVSISAADLQEEEEIKPPQVAAEMESLACGDAEAVTTFELDKLEPIKLTGDELASRCCKVCKKGKACGNSCIARNKTCHKGRGCACDG